MRFVVHSPASPAPALTVDEPAAVKPPAGFNEQSGKQEGWANKDTVNPHLGSPDLSKKAEGDVDSAKVKGTVRSERPQA